MTERPELVADEVDRGDEDDRDRLREELLDPGADEQVEDDEVRREGERRDDEEAETLEDDVAPVPPERPEAVPEVVVRDRDEERPDRRRDVVEIGAAKQQGVDGEVDDVARRPDDAELDELLPVRPAPKRGVDASARRGGPLVADRSSIRGRA